MGGAARDLPWGWWLRADASGFKDDEGRSWRSVRDAYWQGQLGFPSIHVSGEQLDLLTRVLTSIDRRWLGETENRHDLFGGDMFFWRFYMCWIASIGLVDLGRHGSGAPI